MEEVKKIDVHIMSEDEIAHTDYLIDFISSFHTANIKPTRATVISAFDAGWDAAKEYYTKKRIKQ